jgi:ferritin-like metal-binding protein YciE
MAIAEKTLKDLFVLTLRDIYDAERQILRALPKMEKAATDESLREALEDHRAETEEQVKRLEKVFAAAGETPRAKRCAAIRAILAEGDEAIRKYKGDEDSDCALIASGQTVEHYEIARYGALKSWAEQLGLTEAVTLLDATLAEEKAADRKLGELAEQTETASQSGESSEEAGQQANQAEKNKSPSQMPRFLRARGNQPEDSTMNRQSNVRERDENGRFTSDDDDNRRSYSSRGGNYRDRDDDDRRSSSRGGSNRDRDENGRFTSDDDNRSYSSRGGNRDRDESGRFTSDDDRSYSSRGSYRDDDDRRSSSSRGSSNRDRDENGRFTSDDDRSYRGRSQYDDDYRSSSRSSRDDDDRRSSGRSQGGWFGDSEGHSEASRRGWENRDDDRGSSRSRSSRDDDDRRSSSRSRSSDDDDRRSSGRGQGQGGWFGDSEGHSEAARRGWEHRDDDRGSSRARSSRDDDDRRSSSRSRSSDDDRGQGGWFGDSEGHSEAARRGWEHRDDNRSGRSRSR